MEENKDLYANYNHERYAHFRNIKTGGFETQTFKSAKSGTRQKPVLKEVKVSFGEVKELNLDRGGNLAPNLDTEDFTIVSNYLFDFWGAIMGDSAISTYLHLKRYAYGKKDYCYIDIDLIAMKMGKSKNAVKGYLATLEEYGFIAIFLRRDMEDRNRDVSPLFKIRRYVPLITQKMYDDMHEKMKKLHDEFLAQFNGASLSTELPSTNEIIENMVNEGEVINSKDVREKIDKIVQEGKVTEYILYRTPEDQRENNDKMHEAMRSRISKPSYDTWIKSSIFIKIDDTHLQVLANNEFVREWIATKYDIIIKEVAYETMSFNIESGELDVVLMEDYIKGIEGSV